MTKLDELIEQIQSDSDAIEPAKELLTRLISARESMNDPEDDKEAEQILADVIKKHLVESMGGLSELMEENSDPEYMKKTTAAVEEAFLSQGWKTFTPHSHRSDLMQYDLGFSIENTSIRVSVYVEDQPKRIKFRAVLPFIGDQTYEYLIGKEIANANKRFIYGAFNYDCNDGELSYEYSYPITHGFYSDDFLRIMHAIIRTCVDDETFPAIKKAAQGRYKRLEREEILRTLKPLVEDLTDD